MAKRGDQNDASQAPKVEDRFPPVPEESRPRKLYFDALDVGSIIKLESLGYAPRIIASMPTTTPEERRIQLSGVLQGLSDGTIEGNTQRLKGVELALKTLGMLTDTHKEDSAPVRSPETTRELIDALKGFGGSTLRKATTNVNRDSILEQYGNGAVKQEAIGKLRATKKVKKDK